MNKLKNNNPRSYFKNKEVNNWKIYKSKWNNLKEDLMYKLKF